MALGSHTPSTWDNILSTTMHNYRKTLTDNLFNSRPLLNYYQSNGRVRLVSGGISIVEPVTYTLGDVTAYTGYDEITITPKNTVTAAQYAWKQLVATISISGLEEAQNNSREMIINLVEAKVMQAEDTLKSSINAQLYGTLSGQGAEHFTPLSTIIDATGTVGGIDSSVETWWAANEDTATGVTPAVFESKLRALFNKASDAGTERTDAIFTNAYGFESYEATLTPQVRYTDVSKANLGFQNLMFKNCPMFWDFDCSGGTEGTKATTSASFYGLNSKSVGLVIHSERNFKQSPFTGNLAGNAGSVSSTHATSGAAKVVDARIAFITTFGEQTTRNRRRLWKLTGMSLA